MLIVGRATSTEAKALYQAFPDLSELLLLLLLLLLRAPRPMLAARLARSARRWGDTMPGTECQG